MRQQLIALGVKEDGLSVLVRAIPSSTYPILAICFAFIVASTGRDFGPMAQAEDKARRRQHVRDDADLEGEIPRDVEHEVMDTDLGGGDAALRPDPDKPARAINAFVPVCVMVFGTIGGIGASGVGAYFQANGPDAPAPSFVQACHDNTCVLC